jgi:hypoxanthine phosphoribosyltransferase
MKSILFTQDQIQNKVREMADEINSRHQTTDDIVIICVLNGGFMFFSDLVQNISTDVEIDFIRAKSYNGQDQGVVHILKDIETNIEGKHVYVVDDFYDTGNTLNRILEHLSTQNPKSLQIATLLTRDTSPIPDYPHTTGFMVKDEWLIGYGLDDNGKKRNLPYICSI